MTKPVGRESVARTWKSTISMSRQILPHLVSDQNLSQIKNRISILVTRPNLINRSLDYYHFVLTILSTDRILLPAVVVRLEVVVTIIVAQSN
eukprot:scaffold8861_cov98-Cylindrotheca_fusiformis.AAC.2